MHPLLYQLWNEQRQVHVQTFLSQHLNAHLCTNLDSIIFYFCYVVDHRNQYSWLHQIHIDTIIYHEPMWRRLHILLLRLPTIQIWYNLHNNITYQIRYSNNHVDEEEISVLLSSILQYWHRAYQGPMLLPGVRVHLGTNRTDQHERLLINIVRFRMEQIIGEYLRLTRRPYPFHLIFDVSNMRPHL